MASRFHPIAAILLLWIFYFLVSPPCSPTKVAAAQPSSSAAVVGTASNGSEEEKLKSALLAFTVDIYRSLVTHDDVAAQNENIIFSPFTITTSLTALMLGASRETRAELARVLRFPTSDDGDGELYQAVRNAQLKIIGEYNDDHNGTPDGDEIAESLISTPQFYALNCTTSIFLMNNESTETGFFYVRPEYEMLVQQTFYNTHVQVFHRFRPLSAAQQIFRQKTLENLKNGDIFLLNTVHFAAEWLDEFTTAEYNETFYASTDSSSTESVAVEPVLLRTISKTGKFSLLRLSHAEIVELPYKQDEVSLVIILPTSRTGLTFLEETLDSEHWQAVELGLRAATKQVLRVVLPVFSVKSRYEMQNILRDLRLERTVGGNGGAQFDRMISCKNSNEICVENASLKEFVHTAALGVDEDGSETASFSSAVQIVLGGEVTTGRLSSLDENHHEIYEFRVDHPFMFYVRHNPTGIILFSGSIKRA